MYTYEPEPGNDIVNIDDVRVLKDEREVELHDLLDEDPEDRDEDEVDDLRAEIESMSAFLDECNGCETAVLDTYFVEYVEDLVRETGDIGDIPWWVVIDWEETADHVKIDYTHAQWGTENYLVR